jgi:hypothetical protein
MKAHWVRDVARGEYLLRGSQFDYLIKRGAVKTKRWVISRRRTRDTDGLWRPMSGDGLHSLKTAQQVAEGMPR